MSIRIDTERLIVRRMEDRDVGDCVECYSHPELRRFSSRDAFTEEEARELVAFHQSLAAGTEREWLKLAVELKAERKMIGDVCIKVLSSKDKQGEIGWFFNPQYHKQGFATEAARALVMFGFTTLRLHRLTARCYVENTQSFRLMERLGMRREALFREVMLLKGSWHDQFAYAILKDEWVA